MAKNKVYVGNLSWNATQIELQELFGQAGTVTETKIINDRDTGRSKGFAFVTFAEDSMAERAISEFNGYDFMERPLRVSVAEDKPKADRPRRDNNRDNRDRGHRSNDREY